MLQINRVLCPVDFSEFSRHALDHAVAIARQYGGRVTALYVIPPVVSLIPSAESPLYPPVVYTEADLQQFRDELDRFVHEECEGCPVDTLVTEGSPVPEIVRQAGALHADLVVLGTHGRSGFERLVLGSVTERALRKLTTCPVLTVPPRAPDAVPSTPELYARILCAIDFSPSSMKALAVASSFAKEADADLTVLHVVESMPVFEPVPMGGPGGTDYEQVARAAAKVRLREVVPADVRTYAEVTEVVTGGKPYREILRTAAEQHAELIVVGAHGGAAGLLAFGSTLNHVVREATCPVLTVRA